MENRQESTERLERQVRMWRTAALCLGGLALVGGPLGVLVARAGAADLFQPRTAHPAELVTIDLPAGADPDIVSNELEYAAGAREYTLTGATRLKSKHGVKIQSDRVTVRMVVDRETNAARVYIEPSGGGR